MVVLVLQVAVSGLVLGGLVLALGLLAIRLATQTTCVQRPPREEPRALADLRVSASQ